MKIVTSTDLKEYVEKNKKNAESDFPEIIRKLINNTVDNITKFTLPTGNNIIETGPDGILQYHGNNKYLGDKPSIIEIGTNKDYKNKANQDIEKRKELATKTENFIFITPYLWTDRKTSKEKWCREQKEKYGWNDVRVIDAADLENWLEDDIETSKIILSKLGIHTENIFTIEEKEKEFMMKTKKSIQLSFFDYEDKKYEDLISNLNKQYYHIIAPTQEEGLYVTLFYLKKHNNTNTLIIESFQDWNDLISRNRIRNCILIPAFYHEEGLQVSENNVTIFIHDEEELSQQSDYVIKQRTIQNLQRNLGKYYVLNEEKSLEQNCDYITIDKIIKESLGKYIPLKRILFKDLIYPKWYKEKKEIYLVLFFMNSFKTKDFKIFEDFNISKEDLQKELSRMIKQKDPFIVYYQYRDEYRVINIYNAIDWLGNYIDEKKLDTFCKVAKKVLSYIDPKYSEKNIKMPYYIEGLEFSNYSNSLRNGILKGLIITKLYLEAKNRNLLANKITRTINEYYSMIKSKEQFYNFAHIAHKIVELNYESFLNKVIDSINNPNFKSLFLTGKHNRLFSSNEYYNIIFGIEKAINKREYIYLAVEALAKIYTINSENTANSPLDTLRKIFIGWDNLTCLDYEEKIELLKRIIVDYPILGKKILTMILPNKYTSWTPLVKPEYDTYDEPKKIKYIKEQKKYFNQYYLLYLENYSDTVEDIVPIYESLYFIELECCEKIKEKTLEILKKSSDKEKFQLKDIISERIRGNEKYKNENWRLSTKELEFLKEIEGYIKYDARIYDYIYVYKHSPLIDKNLLEEERKKALEIIRENPNQESILLDLCNNKRQAIYDIYNKNHNKQYNISFIKHLLHYDNVHNSRFINIYIREVYINEPISHIIQIYHDILKEFSPEKAIRILTCYGYNETIYQQTINEKDEKIYWKSMELNNGIAEEFVYEKCLEYSNYKMCLEIIHDKPDKYEDKCNLLEKIKETKYQLDTDEEYHVNLIFKYFHNYTKINYFERLATLEIYYSPILEDKTYFLSIEAQKSPKVVAEIIEILTKDDNGNEIELLNKEQIISICYQQFQYLKLDFNTPESVKWCSDLLSLLKDKQRVKISYYFLGELLGRTKIDTKNDIFPNKYVQSIIEKNYTEELKQGFITEVYNNRGVFLKDAGEAEEQLSKQYLYWYKNLQLTSFKTAKILKELSQIYKYESIKSRDEANYV